MLTGPTIWSYLAEINRILHDHPVHVSQLGYGAFWETPRPQVVVDQMGFPVLKDFDNSFEANASDDDSIRTYPIMQRLDLTGDAILIYRRYIHSLTRLESKFIALEFRMAAKDFQGIALCNSGINIWCEKTEARDESQPVQSVIYYYTDEIGDIYKEYDYGEMEDGGNWFQIYLTEPYAGRTAILLHGLLHELDTAIRFFDEPPDHWSEDFASSRRLGVWKNCLKKLQQARKKI
ncbi:hypothetical protein QUF75_17930 [Desulfococcaceae bacterium HSG7]|nr:hypothetical protein [Desulfococcaceae bacterium HSG7]